MASTRVTRLVVALVVGLTLCMTPATALASAGSSFHGAPRAITLPRKTVAGASFTRVGTSPARTGIALASTSARLRLSTLGGSVIGVAPPAATPRVGQDALELETFTRSFTTGGTTYAYRMVGTDPRAGGYTTTVPTTISPISVTVNGAVVQPSSATLTAVQGSGLFTARAFPGGTGQYGDVFMRTQFWPWMNGGTKDWHVVLERPVVRPMLSLAVPTQFGGTRTVRGVHVAFVDVDWLDAQVQSAVTTEAPTSFTQLLAGNVVLCQPYTMSLTSCGIGGYHSATTDASGTHTYSYQAFLHAAVFGAGTGFHDLGPMSHELAEWISDPYTDNTVPAWVSPIAPQYGCVTALESGDPVVGRYLTINGLTYQDEAYLSWFARQKPSTGWLGRYTWLDSLHTYSPSCTP